MSGTKQSLASLLVTIFAHLSSLVQPSFPPQPLVVSRDPLLVSLSSGQVLAVSDSLIWLSTVSKVTSQYNGGVGTSGQKTHDFCNKTIVNCYSYRYFAGEVA